VDQHVTGNVLGLVGEKEASAGAESQPVAPQQPDLSLAWSQSSGLIEASGEKG